MDILFFEEKEFEGGQQQGEVRVPKHWHVLEFIVKK